MAVHSITAPEKAKFVSSRPDQRFVPAALVVREEANSWIPIEDVAKILGLTKRYANVCIRKGYLKGKISYRSHSGRRYRYKLADVMAVLEAATVPATSSFQKPQL